MEVVKVLTSEGKQRYYVADAQGLPIEPIHRFKPILGFQSFTTANKTLKGIEAMNMIRKGQVKGLNCSVRDQINFINQLFEISA